MKVILSDSFVAKRIRNAAAQRGGPEEMSVCVCVFNNQLGGAKT